MLELHTLLIYSILHFSLYINDVPVGLFVFTEKLDATWFDENANPGVNDYKHGVLYKGAGKADEYTDLSFVSNDPNDFGNHGYEIDMEDKAERRGFEPLADFSRFVHQELQKPVTNNTAHEKEVVAKWNKYINTKVFLRK